MANNTNVAKEIKQFTSKLKLCVDRFVDEFQKETQKMAKKTCEDIYEEYAIKESETIERIFKEAVDAFYSSYTPLLYTRTYGLYDLLDIQQNSKGTALYTDDNAEKAYLELFNKSNLHEDRSGNSLFDKVFIKGWHGGAEDIHGTAGIWGAHPSPGTPYYRTGGWVKYPGSSTKKWHKYGKWGRVAVKTTSAYRIFASNFATADNGELQTALENIANEHAKKLSDEIQNKTIKQIFDKVYNEIYK